MQQKSEHWLSFLNAASCPLHKSGELGDKVIRLTEFGTTASFPSSNSSAGLGSKGLFALQLVDGNRFEGCRVQSGWGKICVKSFAGSEREGAACPGDSGSPLVSFSVLDTSLEF